MWSWLAENFGDAKSDKIILPLPEEVSIRDT